MSREQAGCPGAWLPVTCCCHVLCLLVAAGPPSGSSTSSSAPGEAGVNPSSALPGCPGAGTEGAASGWADVCCPARLRLRVLLCLHRDTAGLASLPCTAALPVPGITEGAVCSRTGASAAGGGPGSVAAGCAAWDLAASLPGFSQLPGREASAFTGKTAPRAERRLIKLGSMAAPRTAILPD